MEIANTGHMVEELEVITVDVSGVYIAQNPGNRLEGIWHPSPDPHYPYKYPLEVGDRVEIHVFASDQRD